MRGLETVRAVVGATATVILEKVPPAMEVEIYGVQFANLTTNPVTVEIFERREGVDKGVIEAVSIEPNKTESKGFNGSVIARVHSECQLCGRATGGEVSVTILYRYVPGRSRIP